MQVWSHLAPSTRATIQREASHLDAVGWRASSGAARRQHRVLDLACELSGGLRREACGAGRGWVGCGQGGEECANLCPETICRTK